jgi:FHS family L-fucose permease-like MFS transporter
MAIVGGAAAPPAMGLLYEIWHSMAIAMIVPLVCYAVVTHYAYYGSRMRVSHAESAAVSETAAL